MIWQLQHAKQRFSELVDRALTDGPQVVTRRGRVVVVVLGIEAYRRLQKGERDFARFIRSPPYFGDLEITRSEEPSRVVEL